MTEASTFRSPIDMALSSGRKLIEASAGSGKTRAITTLVVRLVVEDGRELDSILVVTFTKAATAELRERIRKLLREIRQRIENRASAADVSDDDQASELLEKWTSEKLDKKQVSGRIETALLDIDRANVFTIHSFCQRTLAEFAFETGFPFGFELVGDGAGIVENVVRDIWQRRFRDCSPTFANYLLKKNFLPDELARWVGSLRSKHLENLIGVPQAPTDPGIAEKAFGSVFDSARACWEQQHETYCNILRTTDALNRRSYPLGKIEAHIKRVERAFATDELPFDIDDMHRLAQYLGGGNTVDKCKKGQRLPENPMFEAFDELAEACLELSREYNGWLRDTRRLLIEEIPDEIRRIIRAERRLGYDDLIVEMRQALENRNGSGERLAANVRRRFPVALIDEFQDTDPTQERIFDRIYTGRKEPTSEQPPDLRDQDCALYIVGDPKQSIYEFRGADIFAYLSAQQGVDSNLQLGYNWRSSPELVRAVNAIFDVPLALTIPEISFQPAEPGRREDIGLEVDGEDQAPLDFCLLQDQKNIGDAVQIVANETANEIIKLLESARAGRAVIDGKPLRAKDIAVLVNNRHQGREIARALHRRGGKSIEIDDASVFETREAEQIHRLLLALANPGRKDFLRAALTADVFSLNNAQLHALIEEDEAWSGWVIRFNEWRMIWLARGVGAMLRGILDAGDGAASLLTYSDGPRRLTNLYHLTELLQEAETENRFSHAGLLAWLSKRLNGQAAEKEGADDAVTLRLDSDEDLVRIRTIHRSKGLQFPIVYLPFAWHGRQIKNDPDTPVSYHNREEYGFPSVLDLAPDDESWRIRELEEFGQSVRLLYVALTRARYRCVVAWTRIMSGANKELPPLAWLMHRNLQHEIQLSEVNDSARQATGFAVPREVVDTHGSVRADFFKKSRDEFRADIETVANLCPDGIRIRELEDEIVESGSRLAEESQPELASREFSRTTRRIRQMTSFTALAVDHAEGALPQSFVEPGAPDHDESEGDVIAGPVRREAEEKPVDYNAFNFPRGIRVGTCLHNIFEILDEEPGREVVQVCKEQLQRAGIEPEWHDAARTMVENTLATELREPEHGGFRLDDVGVDRRLTELEFCFPVKGLRRAGLGKLLERNGYPGLLSVGEDTQAIDGYLRGFIDLTFEHAGRWHVLDYKSNWLGDKAEDYEPERLGAAMREHRYQLQYLIYLLALHRYLRGRLPDYDYERHIGGAFYLFLRGMDPAAGMSRGVWFDRPSKECIEALDEFMKGGGS